MKDTVRIKSFSKGLDIRLDGEADFDEILAEMAKKFREGKSFFGNAAIAVAFQGRELTETQEMQLVNAIQYNCNLKVVCLASRDQGMDQFFTRAVQYAQRQQTTQTPKGEEIQIYHGNLTGGEYLNTPGSIVLLGDVEAGCGIASGKNILILGSLYGEARAGYGARHGRNFVIALEMSPEVLTVGAFTYIPSRKTVWAKKRKDQLLVAEIQQSKVEIREFTKEYLSRF